MATYDKFDERLETLVMEVRTEFSDDCQAIPDDARHKISQVIHGHPRRAHSLSYERSHTGFIRQIVVSQQDLDDLKQAGLLA